MMLPSDPSIDGLIERSIAGDATAAERDRLAAWRAASAENERHFRRMEKLLSAARSLGPRRWAVPAAPATTAILARARTANGGLRRRIGWFAAAAAVLLAAIGISRIRQPAAWAPAEVVTGATERATLTLPDGTVVRLAPSSRLRLDGGHVREVSLDGRAFFAVTKMRGRPFRVHASGVTARVLGTRFELATDGASVHLAVIEGRVSLDAPRNSVEVGAGEESGVRNGAATRPTPVADTAAATAWLGRFLVFQSTPLDVAAAQIGRTYDVRIDVPDSTLAAATITATFTDRPLEDVIAVVCSVLNARCETRDSVVTITR